MSAEENVRYVATGVPTGWAAMAKTVREVDEDKVKNYKEDIDTILVFTGLFSAVLTAFVIVSYASLSPDKQDTVIQQQDTVIQQQDTVIKLLGQIASQTNNSTVVAGVINSTTPPSHVPRSLPLPFEPSLAALRVNYLWFASLIVTLITASFSMLVKQWLREYLAYDYTSPRERLRARQFRHLGLITWKVYEIAGALPLLLQLGLGLFLLGLCSFTESDLHGIGDMCAVLVAVWASFFITATIAPFLSPRCPYKTPLLKKLAIHVRRLLESINTSYYERWRWPAGISVGFVYTNSAFPLSNVGGTMLFHESVQMHRRPTHFFEEDEAVKMDTELTLLAEVDAFLLDDDLLGTTIYDFLVQYNTAPSDVIAFVRQALTFRLKDEELCQSDDLRRLTKRGWIAVSDIVAATVQKCLESSIEPPGQWLREAIYILFSISDQPLTPAARNALLQCRTGPALSDFMCVLSTLDPEWTLKRRFDGLLPTFPGCLNNLPPGAVVSRDGLLPFIIIHLAAELRQSAPSLPLNSVLDLQQVTEHTWRLCSDALSAMIVNTFEANQNRAEEVGSWLENAIHILLSPSLHPLTSQATKALAGLCGLEAVRQRFRDCMHPLASPESEYYPQVLSRLSEICSAMTNDNAAIWLLGDIVYSIPCTPQCTHGRPGRPFSLALLLYEHAPRHLEWTKCYTSILVERCRAIPFGSGTWPPGSSESFRALLSLPDARSSGDPDVSKVLLALVCSSLSSASSLQELVSIQPTERARIVSEAADRCIVSLISNADTQDRRKFINRLQAACSDYFDDNLKKIYKPIANINFIRHAELASDIHIAIIYDNHLVNDWKKYYNACALAMANFWTSKYTSLPADEQVETAMIAVECLERLDKMEPAVGGLKQWETSFDVSESVFPDEIFQELLAFVPDVDAIARKCKRVRRLQNIGLLPKTPRASHTDEPEGRDLGITELHSDGPDTQHDVPTEVANPILATATEQAHASTDHGRPVPNAQNDDQQRTSAFDSIQSEDQISVSGDEPSSARPGPSLTVAFGEVHSSAPSNEDHAPLEKSESTSDTKHADEGRFHGGRIDVKAPISSEVHDEGAAGEILAGEHAGEVILGAISSDDSALEEDQATTPSEGQALSVKQESVGEGARMDDALTRGTRESLGVQSPLALDDDGGVDRVSVAERAAGAADGNLDKTESAVGEDPMEDVAPREDQGGLARSENAGSDASTPLAPNDEDQTDEVPTLEQAESADRAMGKTESVAVDDPAGTTGLQRRE